MLNVHAMVAPPEAGASPHRLAEAVRPVRPRIRSHSIRGHPNEGPRPGFSPGDPRRRDPFTTGATTRIVLDILQHVGLFAMADAVLVTPGVFVDARMTMVALAPPGESGP